MTSPLLIHPNSENVRGGKSAVRRIVFVWAVRDGGECPLMIRGVI
jgi:hypothetical protein